MKHRAKFACHLVCTLFFPKRRAEVDEAPAMRRDNYQSTSLENSRELMNPGLVGILGKMREHRYA